MVKICTRCGIEKPRTTCNERKGAKLPHEWSNHLL